MSNLRDHLVTIGVISTLLAIISLGPAAIGFTLVLVFVVGFIFGIAS